LQRPNKESFDTSYGGAQGLLVADGFKRYFDKRSAVRELEERKSQMVQLFDKVQQLQMVRFIESIHEKNLLKQNLDKMPRIRVRKASSMARTVQAQSPSDELARINLMTGNPNPTTLQ
jgi:hypothetical protein